MVPVTAGMSPFDPAKTVLTLTATRSSPQGWLGTTPLRPLTSW
jgi:hypothetical protein